MDGLGSGAETLDPGGSGVGIGAEASDGLTSGTGPLAPGVGSGGIGPSATFTTGGTTPESVGVGVSGCGADAGSAGACVAVTVSAPSAGLEAAVAGKAAAGAASGCATAAAVDEAMMPPGREPRMLTSMRPSDDFTMKL